MSGGEQVVQQVADGHGLEAEGFLLARSVSRFLDLQKREFSAKIAKKSASLKCQFFIAFLGVSGVVYFFTF